MNSYLIIKSVHVITVVLSICGFLLRSYWRFYSPHKLSTPVVKVLPHINDTLLLISAIALTLLLKQYPITHDWLSAKLLLLIVYILSGSVALKTRFSTRQSLIALIIAVSSFAAIVMIAMRHSL